MEILDVAKLFRAHNRTRLERLIELAPPQHQVFLQLLPLIFQSNDASLPCYVEGAPFGIVDYQPTETLLGLAKKHYAGLAYSKHAFREYPIQGLYLINDSGSIFYPEQPRFDLWLIYDSHNSDGQTQLLKSKLQAVIKHAKSIGIRLNARILNNAAVNEHKIDSDALDRFYSCGLVLAGCVPLWWLISPSDEQNYANHATTLLNSTPKELSLLDFGPLSHRSATKLVETAIQSSQNAMEKGLPEFLDLYFYQYVMAHFDDNIWLSSRYKQAVYAQETNTFLCDPLLLKFDVVSERLDATHQHQLRQSLYLNCKERLSLTVNNPRYVWRRENMSDFVNEWQWQKEDLVPLDQRHEATIRNRLTEFNLTKSTLDSFNAELAAFAQAQASDTRKLIVQLDKQFHDIFDSPPGVIPALPDAFVAENSEDTLYVEFDDGEALWFISESQRSFVKRRILHPLIST
jgi:adenylate cyclase class 1